MCKYEMDPMSIIEDTERTRFCPQTDRWTDGRTDRRTRWYQYTPFQLRWSEGYKNAIEIIIWNGVAILSEEEIHYRVTA